MLHTLDINIICPGCGHTMIRTKWKDPIKHTTSCKIPGCKYYEIHFKMPALELGIDEGSKELLEERRIINKGW